MLSKRELLWAEKYFTTSNFIAASSIYLKDNFFLERNLEKNDIKDSLLGHWGTCPGINFVYTHLNLIATKRNQQILLVNGPGHGFAAILANLFLEGSLERYYPELTNTREGIGKLIKSFCWPGGFPSHINPEVPGAIHEGGELGYALSTAYGAAFDNPELVVTAIIGDGECETGPTATAWHSNKFLNPKKDGAVLPIIHLNRYKINNPSIYSTMSKDELKKLFEGYGYETRFVGTKHSEMNSALEWAFDKIKKIKLSNSQKNPIYPLIILDTPKGWTGIKSFEGKKIEGNWRSHQVPFPKVKEDKKEFEALEKWLKSYLPEKLFQEGKVPKETLEFVPKENFKIGLNKNANGGLILKDLILPNINKFEIKFKKRGTHLESSTPTLGKYLEEIIRINKKNNFRIFSPDELASNKLDYVLKSTGKRYFWKTTNQDSKDCNLSSDGRVMEMLSEHTLQGWMQGYVLTGRHGLFPSYEAFLPIVDSMVSQYLKFIEMASRVGWRPPISSLNYILSSVCWRQDHNGFSHQNPGFIDTLLTKEKEERFVRIYFPADANMLLAISKKVFSSRGLVNAIVSDKRPIRQWLTLKEAEKQLEVGAGIWDFASDKNPDIVLSACGDYQTQEMMAAISLIREILPEIKLRFVNVNELGILGSNEIYPNTLTDKKFEELFTKDKPVIFSFHGYPSTIKQLLFDRKNSSRFDVNGYIERGTTTTPFEMLVLNKASRYDLVIKVIENLRNKKQDISKKADKIILEMKEKLLGHRTYILENGKDPEEINAWKPR